LLGRQILQSQERITWKWALSTPAQLLPWDIIVAGVRHWEDLIAWQLADHFQQEVERIVAASEAARRNYRYRDQILSSSSDVSKDIVEGFLRRSPLVFAVFLDYALGSRGEAETRLRDGVRGEYFSGAACEEAFRLGRRCLKAIVGLKRSQVCYAATRRAEAKAKRQARRNR